MSIFSHIVLHAFDANGRTLHVGERVDATNWKNVERLVSVKYLRPATPADKAKPEVKPPSKLKKLVIKRK